MTATVVPFRARQTPRDWGYSDNRHPIDVEIEVAIEEIERIFGSLDPIRRADLLLALNRLADRLPQPEWKF